MASGPVTKANRGSWPRQRTRLRYDIFFVDENFSRINLILFQDYYKY